MAAAVDDIIREEEIWHYESEAEDMHGMRLGLDHAKRRVTWGREVDARRAFEKVRQGR